MKPFPPKIIEIGALESEVLDCRCFMQKAYSLLSMKIGNKRLNNRILLTTLGLSQPI
jgi:hypothetical protein